MAEEEKEKTEQPPAKKKSGKLKAIFIFMLLVGFLGQSAFLGWVYIYKNRQTGEQKTESSEKPGDEQGKHGKVNPNVKGALPLEPFLVNLADASSTRYIRTTIKLGLNWDQEAIATKVLKNDVAIATIRNEILVVLSAKKSDDLLTSEGKQNLRKEISERLNKLSLGFKIEEVFFTDFIIQL